MTSNEKNNRKNILNEYPDVLNVKQMCEILGGISTKTCYKMLRNKVIESIRIGKQFRIAKITLIDYIIEGN